MRWGLSSFIFWGIVIALGAGTILNLQKIQILNDNESLEQQQAAVFQVAQTDAPASNPSTANSQEQNLTQYDHAPIPPIGGFPERITKKPFGIYITPKTSPVQPDRFRGYHTGVDIEYEGVAEEIPVKSIAKGIVVFSQTAGGYGGVMVIRHNIKGASLFALYGHLDPKSMLPTRTEVDKGQIIGILGEGKTEETDGARKHLHFAIIKKNSLDIRGYVQIKEELSGWYDPVEFYK